VTGDVGGAPQWWDALNLQPDKVAALRVLGLTPDERQQMLATFMRYRGQDRMPTVPVAPARVQEGLQQQHPIDLSRIRALLNLVGRSDIAAHLHLPATSEDQQTFTNRDRELAEDVVNFETRERGNAARSAPLLRDIYLYLRGSSLTEALPIFKEGDTPVDLVIVPGCRGQGMKLRAFQAVHVLGTAPTAARLFLSGLHPYYARQFDFDAAAGDDAPSPLPFGEADAMVAVVEQLAPELIRAEYKPDGRDGHGGDLPMRQLVIDSRARNSLETIVHCLPVLQEMHITLGRPVNICLVTSPYHMRRFHAITTVRLRHLLPVSHLIGGIVCSIARSSVDMPQLQDPTNARHGDAVGLYIRECLKLLGGRITGEF
jgi:hypothetical protein